MSSVEDREGSLRELRELVNNHDYLVYRAVQEGKVHELSHEDQLMALAIQEHLDLPGVHNALEFADVRDGDSYEIQTDGGPTSPLAHITGHATILQIREKDQDVQAAFEKLAQQGISEHRAIHILTSILMGFLWLEGRRYQGLPTPLIGEERKIFKGDWKHAVRKICHNPHYRSMVTQKFGFDHPETNRKRP